MLCYYTLVRLSDSEVLRDSTMSEEDAYDTLMELVGDGADPRDYEVKITSGVYYEGARICLE